jgi:hypothetical protein
MARVCFCATIPGSICAAKAQPTKTYAVQATLVSIARTPDNVGHALVKATFGEFEKLRPAFANLDPAMMLKRWPLRAAAPRRREVLQGEELAEARP